MNNIRNSIQMWHSHWGFYPSEDKGPDPPIVWQLLWLTLQKACLNTSAVLTNAKPVHICTPKAQRLWLMLLKFSQVQYHSSCLNNDTISLIITALRKPSVTASCKQALRNDVWHCKRMFLRHYFTMNYPSCCVESLFIPHTCSIVNINAPMRRWPMSDISSEGLSPLQLQQRERPEYCTAEVTSLPTDLLSPRSSCS